MSFDPALIEFVRHDAPDLPRGIVAERYYSHPEWDGLPGLQKRNLSWLLHAARSRPQFLAYSVKDLPAIPPLVARMMGLPLLTWTVRSVDDRKRGGTLGGPDHFRRLAALKSAHRPGTRCHTGGFACEGTSDDSHDEPNFGLRGSSHRPHRMRAGPLGCRYGKTRDCVVSCREEIPSCHSHARSGPDRMHDRRLPTNSAGLPPGNRLQLGRYPDRFRCCRLPASTGAARLKSRVNLRRVPG